MAGGGLTGAYYGPAIPSPESRTSRSIGRGLSPCGCCCTLFKLLVFLIIILGIIVLAFWLIFRPYNEMKSYAEKATLTKFTLDDNNTTVVYNLTVDLSIRNPNRRFSIYFDSVQATAYYDDYRIAYDGDLPAFYQGHRNTTVIYPSFAGQQVLADASSTDLGDAFEEDKSDGFFDVDVKIDVKVRFKFWFVKTHKKSEKIKCALKLPVPGGDGEFERTKCHIDFF